MKPNKKAWLEWVASRPLRIREMIAAFPPGSMVNVKGVGLYVLGWNEGDMLILSKFNPADYSPEECLARDKQYVCAGHFNPAFKCGCDETKPKGDSDGKANDEGIA